MGKIVNKIIIRKEDLGKVPDQFPSLHCVSRIGSQEDKCYMPYYKAEEVWDYFKKLKKDRMHAIKDLDSEMLDLIKTKIQDKEFLNWVL